MENWKEPEIVTLEVSETMANITPCEHPDEAFGDIFNGQGYDGCNCGKS